MNQRQNIAAGLFLAPNFLGFLIFTLLPVGAAMLLSLFRWDIFHAPQFVGFQNFVDLLGGHWRDGRFEWNDPHFWKYLGNTAFLMMAIPVSMASSLFLAIMLNQQIRGRSFFRTIFYLPTICAGVALLMLWKYMLNEEFGLVNRFLAVIGVDGPGWLTSYHWAKPAIMMVTIWTTMGGTNMILYLAGLQCIPPELYEAAEIDGAGSWQAFTQVTWPLLSPTTFFIFITSVIHGLQGGFEAAYIMTEGGPDGATTTMGYYIFNHAFQWFNMGYAAAIAVVLFALVFLVTLANWKFGGKKVSYV